MLIFVLVFQFKMLNKTDLIPENFNYEKYIYDNDFLDLLGLSKLPEIAQKKQYFLEIFC